jgi:hypothetical protein
MTFWTHPVPMRAVLIALVATAPLSACAPRAFPASFPPASPASPEAEAAPEARMGDMLQEEPPLPGEPVHLWQGLEEQPPLTKGGAGGQVGVPAPETEAGSPGTQEGGQGHAH